MLLGDRVGPVMVTLWGDLAKNFGHHVVEQRGHGPDEASLVVNLDTVERTIRQDCLICWIIFGLGINSNTMFATAPPSVTISS